MPALASCFFLVVLGSALSGCEPEAAPPAGVEPIPVRLAQVPLREKGIVVRASGVLASKETMNLGFKISGLIERIEVREGDRVRKGALLAALNKTEIRARVSQAEVRLAKAERDYAAARKLYADSAITRERYLDAESEWEHARADLEIARYNLKFSTISAPVGGQIQAKLGEVNEWIEAGRPLFVFLSSEQALVLRAGIADRDIFNLALGDSASVDFDTHPGQPFAAHVSELPTGASPSSGLYEVELTLGAESAPLLPGLMGRAEIHSGKSRLLPAIPIEALVDPDADRGYVYVLDGDAVQKRAISLGPLVGSEVLVLDGLAAGETIVTRGAPYLRDRSQIRVSQP